MNNTGTLDAYYLKIKRNVMKRNMKHAIFVYGKMKKINIILHEKQYK